ncbi:MAG: diacylglycerol/lipid kinase family protein, partial [Anaerolineae bacterium]
IRRERLSGNLRSIIGEGSMRAHLIYNPEAGQHNGHRRVLETVAFLREQGWVLAVLETKRPGDVNRYAGQAVGEGAEAVLVVGGNGTVNSAVNALVGSDVALGVLPMGTGNVWAAELGLIPTPTPFYRPDPLAAARLLAGGEQRWIDLGRATATRDDGSKQTRHFVLWAGVGFDAAVARLVETEFRQVKRRLGPFSFLVVGIDTALHYPGTRATIRFDGQVLEERIVLVIVSNAQLYGGAVRLSPNARLDDGWLNAHIFKGQGLLTLLRHLISVLTRRHRRDPNVAAYDIRHMTIETAEPLQVQVDGEPFGTTPISLEVVPRALKILVPPDVPQVLFSESQNI